MPSQDAKHASEPGSSESPGSPGFSGRLSRRSLLQGAATAGAAGLAVTAVGAAASPALAATSRPSAPDQPHVRGEAKMPAGPIMVHVRDANAGDIEVFSGTSQTRLRDKDLAARIARAIG
jgi:hypothetical protein